jgi:hypothetical protein
MEPFPMPMPTPKPKPKNASTNAADMDRPAGDKDARWAQLRDLLEEGAKAKRVKYDD